jgi:hypothetical protein
VRAPTGQALGRSLLVRGLVVSGPEAQYRASGALLVATAAADGDPARLQRAVVAVTAPAATRTISRKDLVIGDRTAGGARYLGVGDRCAGPVGRQGARDGLPGRVAAADDGLVAVIGLVQDRNVGAGADDGGDLGADVVGHLGADRAGRQETTDEGAVCVEPTRDGATVAPVKRGTAPIADVIGEHDLAIIPADHTFPTRKLDQDSGHRPILMDGSNAISQRNRQGGTRLGRPRHPHYRPRGHVAYQICRLVPGHACAPSRVR